MGNHSGCRWDSTEVADIQFMSTDQRASGRKKPIKYVSISHTNKNQSILKRRFLLRHAKSSPIVTGRNREGRMRMIRKTNSLLSELEITDGHLLFNGEA